MNGSTHVYKNKLMTILDQLEESQIKEIYHFTLFIKKRIDQELEDFDLPSVPPGHLDSLVGLAELGGDALEDTENIYDEQSCH